MRSLVGVNTRTSAATDSISLNLGKHIDSQCHNSGIKSFDSAHALHCVS